MVGTSETETEERVGTSETETEERVGTSETETEERVGTSETETEERVGTSETETEERVGTSETETEERGHHIGTLQVVGTSETDSHHDASEASTGQSDTPQGEDQGLNALTETLVHLTPTPTATDHQPHYTPAEDIDTPSTESETERPEDEEEEEEMEQEEEEENHSATEPQEKEETGPIQPEEPVLTSCSMDKPSTETNHRDPELQRTPAVMFHDPPPPSLQLHHPPAQLGQAPTQLTQSTAQLTQFPAQLTQSPAQLTPSPAQLTQSPAQLTQSPAQLIQSPAQLTQSPAQLTQSPAQLTQSPAQLTRSYSQSSQCSQSPAQLTRSYSQSSQCSQTLTEAHNINAAVLSSGVLCLPGTRDKGGRALVTVTTRSTVWLNPSCDCGELVRILVYYYTVLRKEVRSLGLTVLVDSRRCSPVPALFKAFNILQDAMPGCIYTVLLLADRDLVLRLEKPSAVQVELLTSLKSLHKHVEVSQLPTEFDGSFPFSHSAWVCFRTRVEQLTSHCEDAVNLLQSTIAGLESTVLPATAEVTTVLI
ncbi:puratrophin-1-like [Salvelinus alpinus]|uniref:puratrophin-1-like n=1 Tax=Salvelinus alpinus TaxID=8036 RepID=UPI0039FC77E0